MVQEEAAVGRAGDPSNPSGNAHPGGGEAGSNCSGGGGVPPAGGPLAVIQAMAVSFHLHSHLQVPPLGSREEQVHQAAIQFRQLHLQRHLQGIEPLTHGHC